LGLAKGLATGQARPARRAEALYQRDRATMAFVRREPGLLQQVAREHPLHHLQHRRDELGLRGQLAKRSGIGSDNTHCRTGTCGMTWSTRCAAVCDMRRAPHDGLQPPAFAAVGQQLVVAALAAAQPRATCARMPHSR
jgi:hypothetical protein